MAKADRAPKKIAGLKLPKSIRSAPAIRSLLETKAGRKILKDALIAGAATAAQRVIEAHEAAKLKAGGKKNGKLESIEEAGKPAGDVSAERFEDVEQVAEQIDEPVIPAKRPKSTRRLKAKKAAPDAAPVDDVVPTAVEELIPAAAEPEPAVEPLADGFDGEDQVKPGAAD